MESAAPTLLATDHELFVGDLIDQMRKQRQEKSRSYRHLPYFQHLGSEEVFEALDRVRQANLLQMQLKMQKDCSYLQHMDDMSLEGRNAESVRKRVQEGKLQGGFRQIQSQGHTTVCGCLDCQLRLGNKQFNSSFQYEQSKEALAQKVQRSRLSVVGASWHGKPMLAMHLAQEGQASDVLGTALHVAVLRGDLELVKLFCSRGECDLSIAWGGVSALDLAVANGFEDGGEVLLQHGAPLKHFQHESLTEACERGSLLLLRALLQQLGMYSHQGQAEVLNCTNTEGNTALHLACLLPERETAVKILVAHNCELNKENADGMTPLDCCVQALNRNAWRALRHSTGGQAKYRRYETEQRSLRAAVTNNCLFLVRNVHLRQDDGRKAEKAKADLGDMLHLAVSTAGVGDDMVQYLVEQGADVNATKDGMSVLDVCLRHNNVSESILGRQARLSRYQDYTVFRAAQEGLTGLVRYLVTAPKKSAKDKRQDGMNHREGGCLPLHVAAHRGSSEVVKVLLKSSTNVHEQTNEGKTALDLACMALEKLPGGDNPTSPSARKAFLQFCRTIDALLSRGARLKEFRNDGIIGRARETVQKDQEATKREAQEQKERDELRNETRRQLRRQREEGDDVLRHVEREIRSAVADDDRKADGYKESEKLAKRVSESREILQASWKGDGEKLPEYLSSKYYQIRIDVLRRKIQEKDQQIEEALKKMDFAEEDYLWLLRKKMRDLRLKYHPDKITDRSPTEDDYKFYERITKAYDVLCLKEERDKYLEMSNHVEWLQQHGEEEEARLVEKAIYDMKTQKKAKKTKEKPEEESAQPPKEHVERAKKKLQERREEDTWDKAGEKIKALTLGTPNKCKAPVVTAQRFTERLEQCWIDIEWVCKCAFASAERIEYELRVQAIDKGSEDWAEVYHGWESSVAGLGPFPVGAYEFMVRARNSIGWGEWSDVVVVALDDPKWERQQKREAEQHVLREQAKSLQWDLQRIIDEFQELQHENKFTIHRASNLLFRLQAELKRARTVRSYLPRPGALREAEAAVQVLEKWRDGKEAFTEWKQSISEMKNEMLRADDPQRAAAGDGRSERCDLAQFLAQDEHYFGSLRSEIRNLVVQTMLSLDSKQVFKKLTVAQKDLICSALRRGVELGRLAVTTEFAQEDLTAKDKSRTIFTKHQIDLLQRLADRFSSAHCRTPTAAAAAERYVIPESAAEPSVEETPDAAAEAACDAAQSAQAVLAEDSSTAAEEASTSVLSEAGADDRGKDQEKPEPELRTVHVVGFPHREHVTRGDLLGALRPFAEVDGARIGTTDALVRFSSADSARAALNALEQGMVSLRRSILSGFLATSNTLTEEALVKASAKEAPDKRPVAPAKAAPQAVAVQASQQQQQQRKPQQPQPQPAPVAAQQEPPQTTAAWQLPQQQPQSQQAPQAQPQQVRQPVAPGQQLQPLPQVPLGASQWGGPASSVSLANAEATLDAANVENLPRISMDQLVQSDTSSIQMFECPLCSGLSRQPKITMCCQKVFCGQCLDRWLRTSTCCPSCSTSVVHRDGSTGGCTEASVTKVDCTSTGVQAVLWRVYGSIRIRCQHEQCSWSGNILKYGDHLAQCAFETRAAFQAPGRQQPAVVPAAAAGAHAYPCSPSAPAAAGVACTAVGVASTVACGTGSDEGAAAAAAAVAPEPVGAQVVLQPAGDGGITFYEVVHHHVAADSTQMSLALGDRVSLTQTASNGWAYGRRVQDAAEGWFPTFCLPADRDKPPRPQQAPPPSSPPAGSTQVHRDYAASDPSQLTVKEGELVHIKNRDPSGWTFVSRVMPSTMSGSKREGWIPDWLLNKDS